MYNLRQTIKIKKRNKLFTDTVLHYPPYSTILSYLEHHPLTDDSKESEIKDTAAKALSELKNLHKLKIYLTTPSPSTKVQKNQGGLSHVKKNIFFSWHHFFSSIRS